MKRIVLMLTLLGATSLAQTPSVQRQKPTANDAAIDERAKAALVRMSDYMKTLKAFKINSESAKDEIVDFTADGKAVAQKDPWGAEIDAATGH